MPKCVPASPEAHGQPPEGVAIGRSATGAGGTAIGTATGTGGGGLTGSPCPCARPPIEAARTRAAPKRPARYGTPTVDRGRMAIPPGSLADEAGLILGARDR